MRFIPYNSVVLELGAGYCEFINAIETNSKKIAVDINPDIKKYADPSITTYIGSSIDLNMISDSSIDIVIANNFFEHLKRDDIVKTIENIRRVLSKEGSLLILQPNYRYCYKDYFMFFDHLTPLDDRSMKEILEAMGFVMKTNIPRFLPYTMSSRLPKSLIFLRYICVFL